MPLDTSSHPNSADDTLDPAPLSEVPSSDDEIEEESAEPEEESKDSSEIASNGLQTYFKRIQKCAILQADEEFQLAKKWIETKDQHAANKIISSHLRLVAKVAKGYSSYGIPFDELMAEGSLGIMQALKKFDPEKGYRFSTYAIWWVRHAINEFITQQKSIVKLSLSVVQKKIYFKLRQLKNQIQKMSGENRLLTSQEVKDLATTLEVDEKEVYEVDQRLYNSDLSLNSPVKSGEDPAIEWQEWIPDQTTDNIESRLLDQYEHENRLKLLHKSFSKLSPREVEILKYRRLTEPPLTLEEISSMYKISRERVRQLETIAFDKLRNDICRQTAKLRK